MSLRISEIFGPVLQGEGAMIGKPTMFLRLQGCDSHCPWCDTPYAQNVKGGTEINEDRIIDVLCSQRKGAGWVTITGGNPFLQEATYVVGRLHRKGFHVAVETQGTVYQPWAAYCDLVCVSPKTPSGVKFETPKALDEFSRLANDRPSGVVNFKVVVFGEPDLEFARGLLMNYGQVPLYLQIGNNIGKDTTQDLVDRLRIVSETILKDEILSCIEAVLPQLHILMYGNKRGV